MPSGKLVYVFAFEVSPGQPAPFTGGKLTIRSAIQSALDSTFDSARLGSAPAVTFQVDASTQARRHPIRDAALDVAWSTPHKRLAAATALATRLAASMDNRSKPTLLMVSAHETSRPTRRRIILWTFPQQEVFRLGVAGGQPRLELLDAFNRESRLRKAALLEGAQGRSDLLTARVLDLQQTSTDRAAADLWVEKFLHAKVQMSSDEGTRVLARALRHAHDRTRGDVNSQGQIHAAIGGIRSGNRTRWTIADVARTYMDGTVTKVFTSGLGSEELSAVFDVDRTRFDGLIQYRVFELDNGVLVSAPFAQVGTGPVEITVDGNQRKLVARGMIETEKVRSRGN